MKTKQFSALQLGLFVGLMCQGTLLGITIKTAFLTARQDAWIAYLLGILLGLIPVSIYLNIMNKNHDKNLIDLIKGFPKIISIPLFLIIALATAFTGVITLWNLSHYIISQFLSQTPTFFIQAIFIIAIMYGISKGIEPIVRTCQILFFIALFIFTFDAISLSFNVDLSNIKPTLEFGFMPILFGACKIAILISTPVFFCLCIPKNQIIDKEKVSKYVIMFYLIAGVMCFIVTFVTLAILGPNLALLYVYPEYIVLKNVSFLNFIERVQNILGSFWIMNCFALSLGVINFFCESIFNVFKVKKDFTKNIIIVLTGILILTVASYIFDTSTKAFTFLTDYFYIFLVVIFIAIPLLICLFKTKENNKSIKAK